MSPEKWIYWNTTDRVFYGVACSAMAIWAVAMFIEACRTRPKVQVLAFGLKKPDDKQEDVEQPAKQ